jgi:hypothetical protein
VDVETVVRVRHEFHEGWHIFTSAEVPGLFLTASEEHYFGLSEALPGTLASMIEAETGSAPTVRRIELMKPRRRAPVDDNLLHFIVSSSEIRA